MEIIAPFAELDRGEHACAIHGGKPRFVFRTKHTASTLYLHVRAARITHDWPTDVREIIEDRFGVSIRCWPGVKSVSNRFPVHHLNKLLQRLQLGWGAVNGKHKCRMPGQRPHL